MNIVEIKLSELKSYEKNPRKNENAIDYVAKSIKQFGFKVPIIIDKNNEIVAGHTRYLACKKLGIQKVPCIVADDLTEQQVKAFRLIDNKASEKTYWDFELLDEELANIYDINMEEFDFLESNIEWNNVIDLDEENYEEPEHKMLECPKCHHVDRDIHFKKV